LAFSLQTWWFDTVALFITKIDISRYIDRACIAKGIKSGAAAFDKLMSPSQWFSGNGDKADTDDTDSNKTNVTTVAQYIDSLNAVAQGLTPNAKDRANLKQLPAKQGFSPEEQEVLKTAYSGHRLTPQQVAIIKQITAKL
jgi:hypothetical protein